MKKLIKIVASDFDKRMGRAKSAKQVEKEVEKMVRNERAYEKKCKKINFGNYAFTIEKKPIKARKKRLKCKWKVDPKQELESFCCIKSPRTKKYVLTRERTLL